jgi:hypothetical protein
MSGKMVMLLLLIIPMSVTALSNFSGDSPGITLEGNDLLLMPKMSFAEGAISSLPVYSQSQSIIGAFLPQGDVSNISVCLSPFNLSFYLSSYGHEEKKCAITSPAAKGSTEGNGTSFQLASNSSGMYSLNLVAENNSSVLISMPLLITEGAVVLQTPSIVKADDPFIQVKMNTTVQGNQSKIFAAVMICRKDYENASLGMARNDTSNSVDLNMSLGSKSLQIEGPLKISSELLMKLLPLLPASSAVGLQESTQPGVDLVLLTDKPWVKGEYILTGGIYSPGKGLLGIKQQEIEVI